MEHYTLEKHLRILSAEDKDYELLYSIWGLNKKQLASGLNLTYSAFPHYSSHDVSHSMSVINNIECFLGERRIKLLGATDTFLLLMAGLTHDVGMILTHQIIEKEWRKETFIKRLQQLSSDADRGIAKAAKLLLRHHRLEKDEEDEEKTGFQWALELKNAVTNITAEIFRRKHAQQGADNLLCNEEFRSLAEKFYSTQLPNRFIELLANIAYLHNEDFETVMSSLYEQATGYQGDVIHPRFIACMIRLGDLLDVDSNRFNVFSIASVGDMPETSLLHQQKHASVKHLLVSPSSIEVKMDCPSEEVYRVSMDWYDWLEKEVHHQSREWANIVPAELGGLPPAIRKGSIQILFKGIQARPELLNLKFAMSQKKMFSILQGGGIYKEPGFVFIREIVQNAFDASKIQMWRDIREEVYDLGDGKTPETLEFPDEISQDIYKRYPVTLRVSWTEDKKALQFECSDKGTGISEAALLRMTRYVGESRKEDAGYEELYDSMPYWLRPTSAFGVGLQSVFFVASTFEVETSCVGETSKRIVFRSAAENQYSSIAKENIGRGRGTTVRVLIPKERVKVLFGRFRDVVAARTEDVFKVGNDDFYLAQISRFVRTTFAGIENMHFIYETERKSRNFKRPRPSKQDVKFNKIGIFKYGHKTEEAGSDGNVLKFKICEKKYGSSFDVSFSSELEPCYQSSRLLVRDVIVSNERLHDWSVLYLRWRWNLNSEKTDQLVDISRDNLTAEGRQWVKEKFHTELLSQILELIYVDFQNLLTVNEEKSPKLLAQYFNYCLAAFSCQQTPEYRDALNGVLLPVETASRYDGTPVTAVELLDAPELYHVDDRSGYSRRGKSRYAESIIGEEIPPAAIVVWGRMYLGHYLTAHYSCAEIVKHDRSCRVLRLERKSNPQEIKKVHCRDEKYLLDLESCFTYGGARSILYGLDSYKSLVVRPHKFSGFEEFPEYATSCIYNPFSQFGDYADLLTEVIHRSDEEIRHAIQLKVKEYVPPSMLQALKEIHPKKDIADETILKGYEDLIFDYVKVKKKILSEGPSDVDEELEP